MKTNTISSVYVQEKAFKFHDWIDPQSQKYLNIFIYLKHSLYCKYESKYANKDNDQDV